MQVIDASSIVYGWDNYPETIFPKLWDWISAEISSANLAIPSVALKEVCNVSPDCGEWLKNNNITVIQATNVIMQDAKRIKSSLGIVDDNYGPNGVGENDIIIISTSRLSSSKLISDEKQQPTPPTLPYNMKIPRVCQMTEVNVDCINFLTWLKQASVVFG